MMDDNVAEAEKNLPTFLIRFCSYVKLTKIQPVRSIGSEVDQNVLKLNKVMRIFS